MAEDKAQRTNYSMRRSLGRGQHEDTITASEFAKARGYNPKTKKYTKEK